MASTGTGSTRYASPPGNVLLPPRVNAGTLEAIYQALLEKRQFSATYNGQPERIIHPYGLVQQGSVLYLICRFYDYDDVRITALHRYAEVVVLNEPAREFAGFNIDDYLQLGVMHWSPGGQVRLELKVKPWLANHLDESPLSYQQKLQKQNNGEYLLITNVLDSIQLRRWLLSYSTELEVMQPPELRDWLGQELAKAANKYAN